MIVNIDGDGDDGELNDKITARHYCDAGSTGGSSEEILADGI